MIEFRLSRIVQSAARASIRMPDQRWWAMTPAPKGKLFWRSLENPPEVLAARARDIVAELGYTKKPEDSAFFFGVETDAHVKYIREHDKTPTRWNALAPDRPSPALS